MAEPRWVAVGRLTTFPGQSKYQMIVDDLVPAGAGALMAQLEARRKKLAGEGLFDASRKRPIPFLPDDFSESDTWADPGRQDSPAAWSLRPTAMELFGFERTAVGLSVIEITSGASTTVSGSETAMTVTSRGEPNVWTSPRSLRRVTFPDRANSARESSEPASRP